MWSRLALAASSDSNNVLPAPQAADTPEPGDWPESEPAEPSPKSELMPPPMPGNGTRMNSFFIDSVGANAEWAIWVESTSCDAWDIVRGQSRFNDPPMRGTIP